MTEIEFNVGQLAAVRAAFNLIGHYGEIRVRPPLGTDEYIFVLPPSDLVRRRNDLAQVLTQLLARKIWVVEDSDNVGETVAFPLGDRHEPAGGDPLFVELLHQLGTAKRMPLLAALHKRDRLATLVDCEVAVITQWRAAFSDASTRLLPAGVIVSVIDDPVPGATAVGCRPDAYERLELTLVADAERLSAKYDGYYLVIAEDVLAEALCVLD